MKDDHDVIAPASAPLSFRGKDYKIGPLKVGKIPAFARAIKPIGGLLGSVESMDVSALLGFMAEHGAAVVEALSIASGIPVEELNEADVSELLSLVRPVMQANMDFFVLRLQVTKAFRSAADPMAGAGPTA